MEKNIKNNLEEKIGFRDKINVVVGKAKPYLIAVALASALVPASLYFSSCGGEESECCKNTDCYGQMVCVDCPTGAPCNPSCYCTSPPDDDDDEFMTNAINIEEAYSLSSEPDAGTEINAVEK